MECAGAGLASVRSREGGRLCRRHQVGEALAAAGLRCNNAVVSAEDGGRSHALRSVGSGGGGTGGIIRRAEGLSRGRTGAVLTWAVGRPTNHP